VGLAVALGLGPVGCGKPRIGQDEEVFKTVDALFTAVTARDEKRLADCERRLLTLKDAGRLPPEASAYLDNVIRKARAGRWEPAAQSLYDLMRAQRREQVHKHPRKEQSRPNSGKK
jgi:hypothetical protein